jgi:hypothetical protein
MSFEEDLTQDIDFEFEEFEDTQPTVMGYRELEQRARAGAEIMGTDIEGDDRLARAQRRLEIKQVGSTTERSLLAYYRELQNYYKRFAPDDEMIMFDKFRGLQNYTYKNPYAYLLAFIAVREGDLTRARLDELMKYARLTDVPNLEEADIIRYYRLLKKSL